MAAYADRRRTMRQRERLLAFAAVVFVQTLFGLALLSGLRVDLTRASDVVQQLIDVRLQKPPPPPEPPKPPPQHQHWQESAPKAEPDKLGGSPGPQPAHAPPSVTPVISVKPSAAPSGGGTGTGPALGAGAGGGTGGNGYGDEGGRDLEHIAGEILGSDYPPELGRARIGGRVSVTLTVEPNGLVSRCRIARSSGVPELDSLTCRIMQQRFRFRPSTDRYGRPIRDEVDWDHDWIPPR